MKYNIYNHYITCDGYVDSVERTRSAVINVVVSGTTKSGFVRAISLYDTFIPFSIKSVSFPENSNSISNAGRVSCVDNTDAFLGVDFIFVLKNENIKPTMILQTPMENAIMNNDTTIASFDP